MAPAKIPTSCRFSDPSPVLHPARPITLWMTGLAVVMVQNPVPSCGIVDYRDPE
jgi:hypothetical protein